MMGFIYPVLYPECQKYYLEMGYEKRKEKKKGVRFCIYVDKNVYPP